MLEKRDIYLRSAFRKIWRWGKERKQALNAAKITKNGKTLFYCSECHSYSVLRKVVVDHINPVVSPASGFVGWDEHYRRMYCPIEGLQVLCKKCHGEKTKRENKSRKKAKRGIQKG